MIPTGSCADRLQVNNVLCCLNLPFSLCVAQSTMNEADRTTAVCSPVVAGPSAPVPAVTPVGTGDLSSSAVNSSSPSFPDLGLESNSRSSDSDETSSSGNDAESSNKSSPEEELCEEEREDSGDDDSGGSHADDLDDDDYDDGGSDAAWQEEPQSQRPGKRNAARDSSSNPGRSKKKARVDFVAAHANKDSDGGSIDCDLDVSANAELPADPIQALFLDYAHAVSHAHESAKNLEAIFKTLEEDEQLAKAFLRKIFGTEPPEPWSPLDAFKTVVVRQNLPGLFQHAAQTKELSVSASAAPGPCRKSKDTVKRHKRCALLFGVFLDLSRFYSLSFIIESVEMLRGLDDLWMNGLLPMSATFAAFGLSGDHASDPTGQVKFDLHQKAGVSMFCEAHRRTLAFLRNLNAHVGSKMPSIRVLRGNLQDENVSPHMVVLRLNQKIFVDGRTCKVLLQAARVTVAQEQWTDLTNGKQAPPKPRDFDHPDVTLEMKFQMAAARCMEPAMESLLGSGRRKVPYDVGTENGQQLAAFFNIDPVAPEPIERSCHLSEDDPQHPKNFDQKWEEDKTVYDDVPEIDVVTLGGQTEGKEVGPTAVGLNSFFSPETSKAILDYYGYSDKVLFYRCKTSKGWTRVGLSQEGDEPYVQLPCRVGSGAFVRSLPPTPVCLYLFQATADIVNPSVHLTRILMVCWGVVFVGVDSAGNKVTESAFGICCHVECNKNIIKIGPSVAYKGTHRDSDWCLVENDRQLERKFGHSGNPMPSQSTLIVSTFAFATHNFPSSVLCWTTDPAGFAKLGTPRRGRDNLRKWVERSDAVSEAIELRGYGMSHLQFLGCNEEKYEHGTVMSDGRQLVITNRESISLSDGLEEFTRRIENDGLHGDRLRLMMESNYDGLHTSVLRQVIPVTDHKVIMEKCRSTSGGYLNRKRKVFSFSRGGVGPRVQEDLPPKINVVSRYQMLDEKELEKFFSVETCKEGTAPLERPLQEVDCKDGSASFFARMGHPGIAIPALLEDRTVFEIMSSASSRGASKMTSAQEPYQNIMLHPITKLPFYPGQVVPRGMLEYLFGYDSTTSDVLPDKANHAMAACFRRLYKGRNSIGPRIVAVRSWEREMTKIAITTENGKEVGVRPLEEIAEAVHECCQRHPFPCLEFCGFGGSAPKVGGLVQDGASLNLQSALHSAPNDQHFGSGDAGNKNNTLWMMKVSERVAALFVNLSGYGRPGPSPTEGIDTESLFNLGYCYLRKINIVEGLEETHGLDDEDDLRSHILKEDLVPFFTMVGPLVREMKKPMAECKLRTPEQEATTYYSHHSDCYSFRMGEHLVAVACDAMTNQEYATLFLESKRHELNDDPPPPYLIVPLRSDSRMVMKVPCDAFPMKLVKTTDKTGKETITRKLKLPPGFIIDKKVMRRYGELKKWKMDLAPQIEAAMNQGGVSDGSQRVEMPTELARLYAYGLKEYIELIALCNASVAQRANESHSLVPDPSDPTIFRGTYLDFEGSHLHQSTCRSRCTPSALRTNDVGTLYFIHHCKWGLRGSEPDRCSPDSPLEEPDSLLELPDEPMEEINKCLFASILWEHSGVPACYDTYQQMRLGETSKAAIPFTEEDCLGFCKHVKEVEMDRGGNRSIKSIVNEQRANNVPQETKTMPGFEKFLDRMKLALLLEPVENVFGISPNDRRGDNLYKIARELVHFQSGYRPGPGPGMEGHQRALEMAHFVMANVEDIYRGSPCGRILDATDLSCSGTGFKSGLQMTKPIWQNRELAGGDEQETRMRSRMEAMGVSKERADDKINLQKLYEAEKEWFHETAKKKDYRTLNTQGFRVARFKVGTIPDKNNPAVGMDDSDGRYYIIVNIINGRAYSIVDTEHRLCKVWIVSASSDATRSCSRYMRSVEPYCHPPYPGRHGNPSKKWFEMFKSTQASQASDYLTCRKGENATDDGESFFPMMGFPEMVLRTGETLYRGDVPWRETFDEAQARISVWSGKAEDPAEADDAADNDNTGNGTTAGGGAAGSPAKENGSPAAAENGSPAARPDANGSAAPPSDGSAAAAEEDPPHVPLPFVFPPQSIIDLVPSKGLRFDCENVRIESLSPGTEGQKESDGHPVHGHLVVSIPNDELSRAVGSTPSEHGLDPAARTTLFMEYNFIAPFGDELLDSQTKLNETVAKLASDGILEPGLCMCQDEKKYTILHSLPNPKVPQMLFLSLLEGDWDDAFPDSEKDDQLPKEMFQRMQE